MLGHGRRTCHSSQRSSDRRDQMTFCYLYTAWTKLEGLEKSLYVRFFHTFFLLVESQHLT